MSVESLAVVLHHSQASGTDKLVLVGIANHDGDGGAWPSVSTLAKYANVSTRSINRALDNLKALGEVIVYIQAGGTRATADHKRPNRYEITVECPEGCDRTRNHRVKPVDKPDELPLTPASPPDASVTPPPDASVTPPPDASVTRTILSNHPANPSLEVSSPADRAPCWSCGQEHPGTSRYCRQCSNRGMDTDIINCSGCGCAARRQEAGQQSFICNRCQGGSPWEM